MNAFTKNSFSIIFFVGGISSHVSKNGFGQKMVSSTVRKNSKLKFFHILHTMEETLFQSETGFTFKEHFPDF